MTCEICKRSSCTRSFHSIEEQERYDARQEMSGDIDELREDLQLANEEIDRLNAQIIALKSARGTA